MALALSINSPRRLITHELHDACAQQWLARLRGLGTYARVGMRVDKSSDAPQLAAACVQGESVCERDAAQSGGRAVQSGKPSQW